MNVKLTDGYVVDRNGVQRPITSWFDEFGDDCDAKDAVVVVAGTELSGFVVVDLRDLERVTEH